jgi:hypothetical protein
MLAVGHTAEPIVKKSRVMWIVMSLTSEEQIVRQDHVVPRQQYTIVDMEPLTKITNPLKHWNDGCCDPQPPQPNAVQTKMLRH